MSGVRFTNKLWAALFKLRHYPAARCFARNRARSTVVSGRPAVGGERDRPEKSYRGAHMLRNLDFEICASELAPEIFRRREVFHAEK